MRIYFSFVMTVNIEVRGPIGIDLDGFLDRDGLGYVRGPIGVGPLDRYGHNEPVQARGPVGVGKGSQTTLFLDGSGRRGGATRGKSGLKMKVIIIEHPKQSIFTSKYRKSIKTEVSSELKRIGKDLKKSKAKFTVSWTLPKTLPLSAAVPTVLMVYVIENTAQSIQQAIKIRNAALPGLRGDDQKLANHVGEEAGFNAKKEGGKTSVSFLSATRAQRDKRVGVVDLVANIILHEIGHGMGAEHSDKGVMSTTTVYGSTGRQLLNYTKSSIKKIDRFLSTL